MGCGRWGVAGEVWLWGVAQVGCGCGRWGVVGGVWYRRHRGLATEACTEGTLPVALSVDITYEPNVLEPAQLWQVQQVGGADAGRRAGCSHGRWSIAQRQKRR